jgi:NAD(P)-dependent dehydrogenase (short-subunit alcohol dehydrogenase family)
MRSIAKHFWLNDKIRVNAICPGVVKTNLLAAKEWGSFPDDENGNCGDADED